MSFLAVLVDNSMALVYLVVSSSTRAIYLPKTYKTEQHGTKKAKQSAQALGRPGGAPGGPGRRPGDPWDGSRFQDMMGTPLGMGPR